MSWIVTSPAFSRISWRLAFLSRKERNFHVHGLCSSKLRFDPHIHKQEW